MEGKSRDTSASDPGSAPTAPPSRKRKKEPIVAGVAIAVLVVAGFGFWTWHEQPSFCNAVCHEPMDSYVEGYYEDASLLAHTHMTANVTCLDCHPAKIDEQVSEATKWVRGDFEMTADGQLAHNGLSFSAKDCLKSGCHDYDTVVAATENWGGQEGVNPHYSHQFYGGSAVTDVPGASENAFAMDCSWCHSSHGQSNFYCNTCHEFDVPAGWSNPADAGK